MSVEPASATSGFEVGSATHRGLVRTENEDAFLVLPPTGLFAVADGMGGHEGGALASARLVDELAAIGTPASAVDLLKGLEAAVLRANAALQAIGRERRATLGTTLAALLVHGQHFACVWCGDSRIYRVRNGAITRLSRDHTEVQALVDRGLLSLEEARTSPRRNVITRAVGVWPEPELEMEQGDIEPGDAFLICSDGLTGHVEDDVIGHHVARTSPQGACDALLALALDRGGTDNITVVIVARADERFAPARETTLVMPGGRAGGDR